MIKFNISNGLCRGMTDVFFPPNVRSRKLQKELDQAAKDVCAVCPQIEECLEYALKHEDFGVWGGMTETERRKVRNERNIFVVRPEVAHLQEMKSEQLANANRVRTMKSGTE